MSKVFKNLGDKFLKVFVDDLNVHNESWEEHLQHLDIVFFKLREVNLKLNLNKCCFVAKNITFLRHVVNKDGTKPNPGLKLLCIFQNQRRSQTLSISWV